MFKRFLVAAILVIISLGVLPESARGGDTPFDGMIGIYEWMSLATPAEIASTGAEYAFVYCNNISNANISTWLDDANAAGLKVALLIPQTYVDNTDTTNIANFASTFDSKPAVAAWYLYDEPGTDMVDECEAAYAAIKTVSNKPVCLLFCSDSALRAVAPNACDFVLVDSYPIAIDDEENWSLCDRGILWWKEDGYVTEVEESWDAVQDVGKPWIVVCQAYGWNSTYGWDRRLPTDGESRFMHYYAMKCCSQSVCYWARCMALWSPALSGKPYPYDGSTWLLSTGSNAVFQNRCDEMDLIGDAFDNGAITNGVNDDKSRIDSRLFLLDNGDYYICLMNHTYVDENVTVTVNVSGYTQAQLVLDDTSTTYTLNSSNEFTYTMTDFKIKWFKLLP